MDIHLDTYHSLKNADSFYMISLREEIGSSDALDGVLAWCSSQHLPYISCLSMYVARDIDDQARREC